jgi:hypothetical protein
MTVTLTNTLAYISKVKITVKNICNIVHPIVNELKKQKKLTKTKNWERLILKRWENYFRARFHKLFTTVNYSCK